MPAQQRKTLTERRIKTLAAADREGDVLVYDDVVRGLAIRLRPTGRPRWYLQKWANGGQHRVALGEWPGTSVKLARELARANLVQLARGIDPVIERRKAAAAAKAEANGGKVPFKDAIDHLVERMRTKGRSEHCLPTIRMAV